MSYCYSSPLSAPARCVSNQILASVTPSTWLALEGELQEVDLCAGASLHGAGMPLRHVYFPTTAVLSLVSQLSDGSCAEVAAVGAEGVVGLSACMGSTAANETAVVQAPGRAWRMAASSFAQLAWQHEDLMRPALRYGQALMTQIAQTSACNCRHGLEQRMCRWILSLLDRQAGPDLQVTHERIASMLGVRREGITTAAARLQALGVIRCSRGHLQVLDRPGLEARSCECHTVLRASRATLMDEVDAPAQLWRLAAARPGAGFAGIDPIVNPVARHFRAAPRQALVGQES